MAKSLAEKLQIKPGTTLWSSDPVLLRLIGPLPDCARTVDRMEQAATALVFRRGRSTKRGRRSASGR